MLTLQNQLQQLVDGWEAIGHSALLERFVLRNGKAFAPGKRIGRKGKAKECFKNATDFVLRHRDSIYVEGYVTIPTISFPILHAWVTLDGKAVMDPTLDASEEGRQYFGISFTRETLLKEILQNKYYGLLDTGVGLNARLIFGMDPELQGTHKRISKQGMRNVGSGLATRQ
jgi:hypothetical protein